MKAETLKKAILQYAMQGKLVGQNPNDEPASELLKKIKAEKEYLVKDGKILKKKELPPFKDSDIPFKIPSTWTWAYLSEVSLIQEGAGIRSYQYRDSGIQLLTVTNILEGGIDLSKSTKFVGSNEYKDKYKHLTPQIGDIVTACSGGSWGKSAIYDKKDTVMLNTSTLRLRFFGDLANNKYLYFITKSEIFKKQLECQLSGMQPNFGYQHYSKILIPIPPLAEQQRIVKKLEEILPLVEKYCKNEEELEKLNKTLPDKIKQSILQHAVQGKLVPQNPNDEPASELLKRIQAEKEELIKQGKIKKEKPLPPITKDEKPFSVPDSWTWCRVSDIGIYKKGPFGSALTKKIFVPRGNNTIKVYEQKNAIQKDATLGNYYISKEYYEKSMKNFKVSAGDVIVSCAGTIGETYVMPDNIELGIINQALMRMTITKDINLKYFLIYFDIILKKDSKTYSKGSAIKNIPPFDILKKMLIPLPPIAEQQRIVDKVEELMKIVDKLKV